ncbi:hypothetical protein [Gimesia chilikensis]|uniref:hypothetical protein n=1 Tax=Gimesia chilikensis TaxID=2605989 RepID=UPI001187F814|nr:hypothetical protein [Gimesia chilikensis]QDT84562.1 hypothetical protein MalM14_22220 [Gimesia chilikensis]
MAQIVKRLLLCSCLAGCNASPPEPTHQDLTGESLREELTGVTDLQYEIIRDAIARKTGDRDQRIHVQDDGEYEDGEHFFATAGDQRYLVVFDIEQDKIISITLQ